MKKLNSILFLLILIFFTDCSSESSTETENTNQSTDKNKAFLKKDTIIPFSGFWINEKYYLDVLKTKSPKESQEIVGFCAIDIPRRTLQTASPWLNFHESGDDFIVKNGNIYQLFNTYDSLKKFDIEVLNNGQKIKLGNDYFIRLKTSNVLEEILFAGKYRLDDKIIELTKEGKILGLDEFNFYQPAIDYSNPGSNIDIIDLGKSKKNLDSYTFKYKDDSLLIFEYKCIDFDSTNNFCIEVDYGVIKYKMKKL